MSLSRLIRNLNGQERRKLNSTVMDANTVFSLSNDEKAAARFFKHEKNKSFGKLKKVYAAFQKSKNLKHALDVHFQIKAEKI